MSARATATLLAVSAFLLIVVVGLLGADRPPPPGFLLVVVLAAGYAIGVRVMVPRLLLLTTGRSLFRAGLYSAGWSLVGWSLALLATPWSAWLLIGLIVLCTLGAIGGILLMGLARLIAAP